MFQSDTLQSLKCGWSLEEILFVEIIIVKNLFDKASQPLVKVPTSNFDNSNQNADGLNKNGNI